MMTQTYEATREDMRKLAQDVVEQVANQAPRTERFRLREYSAKLLGRMMDPAIAQQTIPRPRAAQSTEVFGVAVEWWIGHYFRHHPDFVGLGGGWFRRKADEELDEEVQAEAEEDAESEGMPPVGADDPGFIYAFTLPAYMQYQASHDGRYLVKVGKTRCMPVVGRIKQQTREGGEFPVVLGAWRTRLHSNVEACIHSVLNIQGRRADSPGREWFWSTREEVESLLNFITGERPNPVEPTALDILDVA